MALNNINAAPPEGMADWVREVESTIKALQQTVAAQTTQLNARR